ncbi:hypothetical protein ACJX0J_031344, partial [Zea mays]
WPEKIRANPMQFIDILIFDPLPNCTNLFSGPFFIVFLLSIAFKKPNSILYNITYFKQSRITLPSDTTDAQQPLRIVPNSQVPKVEENYILMHQLSGTQGKQR